MSNKTPQNLKGFRDFQTKDALSRKWLKEKLANICESWGYDPIETPTLEPLEIFEGQIGEDEKLFYKFKDPGNRDVALRYDQTVPTCRFVGQYSDQLQFPFRRYQIQPVFRAENTQRGRYREFFQVDADIFGVASALADAEVIALSLDIYRKIGFPKAVVLVNDRALLKDIPYEAIVAIDKLKKIGSDGVVADMVKKGIPQNKARGYLNTVQNLKPSETVNTILNYLKNTGFKDVWFKFEPTLARSFSYSTGPIWEVEIPGFTAGSVLGGERFDKLIEQISGKQIAGTGFGLGFDRTLEAAQQFGLIPEVETTTKVLVTVFSPELLDKSAQISSILRESQVNVQLYPDENTKMEKQLKYADKRAIPFVVIIGPEEAKSNTVVLKNMQSGEQKTLPAEKLTTVLASKGYTLQG